MHNGRHSFFFDENTHFDLPFINNLKTLNVLIVIKKYKRSLNGTTIYTRNCLIGNGFIEYYFLSLEKDKLLLVEK